MEPTIDPAWPPQAPANLEALLGGRGLQIAGLLSLFASAAFFFKLAVDHGWLDPLVRVLIGAAAGLFFCVLGVTHRRATVGHRAVSEGFIALGAALLFLTAWAAGPLFALVPNWAALGVMGAVTGVLTFFAIRMRSEVTAIYGLIGGLLAPALAPLGDDRLIIAAYLLALCAGMLRAADRGGFRFVTPLAMAGVLYYSPDFFVDATSGWTYLHALVTCALFFAEFAVATLATIRRGSSSNVDRAIAALNVVLFVGFAWADLYAHTWILTLVLAAFALALAVAAGSIAEPLARTIVRWAAGAVATLAVFPATDLHFSTAAAVWALEAAVLYGIGARSGNAPPRLTGLAMIVVSAPFVLGDFEQTFGATLPFANMVFIREVVVALAFVVLAVEGRNAASAGNELTVEEHYVPFAASIVANAIGLAAVCGQTSRLGELAMLNRAFGPGEWVIAALSIVATAYAVGLFAAGHLRGSRNLRVQSLVLFTVVLLKVLAIDLMVVELVYRVATLFGIGVATLAISAIYLRRDAVQRFFTRSAE